ncbi:MAG: helicase-related protein [Bacilli bacterium]
MQTIHHIEPIPHESPLTPHPGVIYVPGIGTRRTMFGTQYECRRCHTKSANDFHTYVADCCMDNCTYCRRCLHLGKVRSCDTLPVYAGPETELKATTQHISLHVDLTPEQTLASQKITQTIRQNDELLLWAVCGAGKTEMLFQGILYALNNGRRVAIVSPRRDVITELLPRIQMQFPNTPTKAWYGTSEENGELAPLVLSTVHQLWQIRSAFSVVIVDEVDAFPLLNDETLHTAIQSARTPESATIFLTATPSLTLKRKFSSMPSKQMIIPIRYHRYLLPVPTMKWCGDYRETIEKGQLPKQLKSLLSNAKHQTFVFFPSIQLLERAARIAENMAYNITATHSKDPDRAAKIQSFREGKHRFIFTTTILERGVTVAGTDCIVVGACDRVFTEGALVQIAGRVGRNTKRPTGKITFLHNGPSDALTKAIAQIQRMNALAREVPHGYKGRKK